MLSGSETAITTLPREKIHQLDDSKKNKRIKNAKDDIEKTCLLYTSDAADDA